MACGRFLKRGLPAPHPRLAALAAALGWVLLVPQADLRAQNPVDVPPPAAASAPEASPRVEALRTGPDLAALSAPQPFGDPALVYVPPSAEGILTAELSAFGDDPALLPLYGTLLQALLASAPIPSDRLEDLEGFTCFLVPYDSEANGMAFVDPVTTPEAYLAQSSVDSTQYGYGFVLRFREPFYDRDLKQALGPEAVRIGSALIPTYQLRGSTVRLLENRYLVLLQNELSPGVIPYLNPGSFARTPTGLRIAELEGPTLRARALVSGSLLRELGSTAFTVDDRALFQTFWGDRVEAWTLRLDSVTVRETTRFVFEAMIVTNSEAVATTLEEDLVGVVRLALAAARDQTAHEDPSVSGESSALHKPAGDASSAAKLLVRSIDERRLSVGHIGPAAGVRLVMLPEEMEALPGMLSGMLFAAPNGDALEQDRERQRRVLRAMRAYYDANGHLPPPVVYDAQSGQPRSWRVDLLPFLGEQDLFAQYRRDEPWDSPHNRSLIDRIPDVYRSSFDTANPPRLALAALVHPDGVFSPEGEVRGADIADGGARTAALATVRLPIPWIRPQDIDAMATEALSDLAWTDAGVLTGFADGRVHLLRNVGPGLLRQLVERDDALPVGDIESLPGVEVDPQQDPVPAESLPTLDPEGNGLPEIEEAPRLVPPGRLAPQKNPFADEPAPSSQEPIARQLQP